MPILHTQVTVQAKNSEGKPVQIPPMQALCGRGPIVRVTVDIIPAVAQQIVEKGVTLPDPVAGWALIDTGATTTCIDDEVAKRIGAPVIDTANMCSATHDHIQTNIYPIRFEIVGSPVPIHANVARCMGAALGVQGLVMLIGRDVLALFTLHYNGPQGQFTLAF